MLSDLKNLLNLLQSCGLIVFCNQFCNRVDSKCFVINLASVWTRCVL